ncbi:MAG: ABC transporter ATP-binding protein, partial [Clostridia bacterium]|nr:ABC transporter ATP-binding protein [Clostridia bacterium]
DPTRGRILLDGRDIRLYTISDYYDLFGIVFQDFGKYAVTVRDNIRFGNIQKDAPDTDVHRAAEQSDAASYIDRLPKGLDTPLMRYFEEDGTELSTGQWQKLAVARAFYGDKDILILDEPTASLDAIAEQEIFRQFDTLRRGKTTVFVSHRLSSAADADKIAVIEDGKLVEEGTHATLMKKNGLYAKMFSVQAKKYIKK